MIGDREKELNYTTLPTLTSLLTNQAKESFLISTLGG